MNLQSPVNEQLSNEVEYVFPATVEQAVQLLSRWAGEARLIAGGTDLMLELGKKKVQPRCLVSTEQIRGLNEIKIKDDCIEVGAAVTFADILNHPYLNEHVQVLADAARSVGSLAIQNAATLVGNIVNAMPAADGAIAAIALEAEAQVVDAERSLWKPVESLYLGPGASIIDPTRQLVAQIRFSRCDHRRGTAWIRLGRRPSLTLPILNCAVNVYLDGHEQKIKRVRIALGPVAPRPFRAFTAEQFLTGRSPDGENLAQAALLTQKEANPRGNVLRASRDYRLATIPVMVECSLRQAVERALNSAG
jgi:CO/xanthine dehydrogenase FAD-binding subunit